MVAILKQRHRPINPSPNYLIHSEPSMKQPAHMVWQYNIRVKKNIQMVQFNHNNEDTGHNSGSEATSM